MATAHVNQLGQISAREEDGVVQAMSTRVIVTGLSETDLAIVSSALATSGVPVNGDTLSGYPELVLRRRIPTVLGKGEVQIDLEYVHLKNAGQDIDTPAIGNTVVGEVRVNVQQVKSNLDRYGSAITVTHTWPSDHPTKPNKPETQGGEVTYFQPQRTLIFEAIKTTARPWLIVNQLAGAVNESPWQGDAARTWMCTGISWEILSTTNRYKMTFEFQHNPDTWDASVIFVDETTGRPPPGLVANEGYKKVEVHPVAEFERVIGRRLQAG